MFTKFLPRSKKMKKSSTLKFLNPIIALLLLNQICTALFSDLLGKETFEAVHETGGILLAAGGIFHLVLNWNWVKANYFKK